MSIAINEELINLNIDILAKTGIKKSTINKLHKLKARTIGDIANIDAEQLEQLLAADEGIDCEQLAKLLSLGLFEFASEVFASLQTDSVYEIVMLHVNNHTHQEIAQKSGLSKEKVKQNIGKFLQGLFTLVDAIGSKLIENKPYIGIEEIEAVCANDNDYKLLLLVFRAHDTKWLYHNEAECFTKK